MVDTKWQTQLDYDTVQPANETENVKEISNQSHHGLTSPCLCQITTFVVHFVAPTPATTPNTAVTACEQTIPVFAQIRQLRGVGGILPSWGLAFWLDEDALIFKTAFFEKVVYTTVEVHLDSVQSK